MGESAENLERKRTMNPFRSIADQSDRTLTVGIILVASALSVVVAAVLTQYYAIDVITSLLVADPRDCTVTGMPRIGQHCFGDYSIVVDYGLRSNPWEPFPLSLPGTAGPATNNYPPTTMLPHLLFGLVGRALGSPIVGLLGYILALTAAVLTPAFWAARGAQGLERIVVFIACGVAAIPAWGAVDRGNSVGFLAPLGLLFLVAICRQRWGLVAVAVVLAAMLKPQFVVMAVIFFVVRKWRLGLTSIGLAVLLNFAGYLLWPRDFPQTIMQSIHGLFAYAGAESHLLSNVNVAFPNAVLAIPYGIAAAIRGETPPPFPGVVHTLSGLAVLVIVVIALLGLGRRVPPVMAGMVLLATASLIPALSNRYYLVFALPIAALVVRDPNGTPGVGLFDRFRDLGVYRRSVGRIVSIAIALTIAEVAVPGPPFKVETPQLNGTFATTELVVTTANLTPILWLTTCAVIIVAYWRRPVPEDPVEATKESVAQRD